MYPFQDSEFPGHSFSLLDSHELFLSGHITALKRRSVCVCVCVAREETFSSNIATKKTDQFLSPPFQGQNDKAVRATHNGINMSLDSRVTFC